MNKSLKIVLFAWLFMSYGTVMGALIATRHSNSLVISVSAVIAGVVLGFVPRKILGDCE